MGGCTADFLYKAAIVAVLVVLVLPFMVFMLSRVQMLGWLSAVEMFEKRRKVNHEKEHE